MVEQSSTVALEHALMMVLLLVSLLSLPGRWRRWIGIVVFAGIALSMLTPAHTVTLAWPLITSLVVPALLWQVAIQLATVDWLRINPRMVLAWAVMVSLIGCALMLGATMPPAKALLLSVVAASLMWQTHGNATEQSGLGVFGPVAVALLLVEADIIRHHWRPFISTLFVGVSLGTVLGFVGVRAALRLRTDEGRKLFCLALVYSAFAFSAPLDASGVVAAMAAGFVLAEYGYRAGLWASMKTRPAPLRRPTLIVLMTGAFLLLGWQAHLPLRASTVGGIGLSLTAAAAGLVVAHHSMPAFRRSLTVLLRQEWRLFLLLAGTLLLWPTAATVPPTLLATALAGAVVAIVISLMVTQGVFEVFRVEVRRSVAPAVDRIHVFGGPAGTQRTIQIFRN